METHSRWYTSLHQLSLHPYQVVVTHTHKAQGFIPLVYITHFLRLVSFNEIHPFKQFPSKLCSALGCWDVLWQIHKAGDECCSSCTGLGFHVKWKSTPLFHIHLFMSLSKTFEERVHLRYLNAH